MGYKLNSYIAGTSTPQSTYPTQVDALALTNANANPTILDSNGSANVWLPNNLSYKFILQDASNNTIWTVDNVNQGGVALPNKSNVFVTYAHNTDVLTPSGTEYILSTTNNFTVATNTDSLTEFTTSNGRFTAKNTGNYFVMATANFTTTGVTFSGNAQVYIDVGGAASIIPIVNQGPLLTGASALTTQIPCFGIIALTAAQFIDVRVKVTFSGGTPVFSGGQLMVVGL